MNWKWSAAASLVCVAFLVISLPGCGSNQRLVGITVSPSSATFLAPQSTLSFQFTAIGLYTHPPATKDLTDQVTWASNAPGLVAVSTTGLVSPAGNGNCGIADISASVKTNDPTGNVIVSNSVAVTVADKTNPICPQP